MHHYFYLSLHFVTVEHRCGEQSELRCCNGNDFSLTFLFCELNQSVELTIRLTGKNSIILRTEMARFLYVHKHNTEIKLNKTMQQM